MFFFFGFDHVLLSIRNRKSPIHAEVQASSTLGNE